MGVHFEYLDRFCKRFDTPASKGDDGRYPEIEIGDKLFACSMLVHAADISNPAKPREIYFDWTDRVLAEFYAQGRKEKECGLPVSPFFDMDAPSVPKLQTG